MKGGEEATWNEVDREVIVGLKKAVAEGKQIVLLTETIISPSTRKAVAELAKVFEGVKHITFDSLSYSGVLAANEESFGVRALADYHFDKAEVVVSFGSDFLSATPNSNANAARYAKMRKPKKGKMSRHFQFEANMSLTNWSGSRVRKHDVVIAKNYLTEDEIDTLNRLVVIFLEQAELRVKQRKDLTLEFWRKNVDDLLRFNDKPVLDGPGKVNREDMTRIAYERYEAFDAQRRITEAAAADAEDLREIENIEQELKRNTKNDRESS
jgi:hypothetical protein